MSTTATRLITLIMLLQRQPNQKAAALAAELGISVRTLHRYFGMLDEMGIPIYAQRGHTHVPGIVVTAKGKTVATLQPAVVSRSACFTGSYFYHCLAPVQGSSIERELI